MKHTSVKMNTPCEFINITPVNPLISHCQIKVCYVSDEPNRNRSVITKQVATQMAASLPGSPIVGYYNEAAQDFEEHNRSIEIANGQVKFKDVTRPYGFVDLGAKVWFQKFLDDGVNEREYLMTEGYIWTGQYPEAQRIIDQGNNQSMELSEKYLDATWTKDNNGKPQFFIINEAIVSKLCILGEECEPCFEGSQITKLEFSFDQSFKDEMTSMMNELKELLKEGGAKKVFTTYAVEIGDNLWTAIWDYLNTTYPQDDCYSSQYRVDGIYEEDGQKFAVLQQRSSLKYFRMDFAISEENGFVPSDTLIEVTKSYTPAEVPQFAPEAVAEFETSYAASQSAEETEVEDVQEPETADTEVIEAEPVVEDPEPEAEATYSLEEIPEYIELQTQMNELQTNYSAITAERDQLLEEITSLREFKLAVEKKEKQAMIDSFYMLSDEDKRDVITNIDTYSLEDIEAKLSIICVRNKVSFDLDEDKGSKDPITYNLHDNDDDVAVPAWVKALRNTAKSK